MKAWLCFYFGGVMAKGVPLLQTAQCFRKIGDGPINVAPSKIDVNQQSST
jgi:hypothetical protein